MILLLQPYQLNPGTKFMLYINPVLWCEWTVKLKMAKTVGHRDVGPIIKAFRSFLLGRDLNKALRFQDEVATRSPPPPILPDGPSHKLSANYYYTRDGRRECQPNEIIVVGASRPALTAGDAKPAKSTTKLITPGQGYVWKDPSSD